MARKKLAVLISGRGSNLDALIDACADEKFPAEVTVVISNKRKAPGLEYAHRANITTHIVDHKLFSKNEEGREKFDASISKIISEIGVDYICLAGFMRMLSPGFVAKWRGKLINIHPSLLPSFKGLNVHERMIDAGVKVAGCTVHFVSDEMDAGPIIGQAAVPVLPTDNPESLAKKILAQEHKLYAACIRLLSDGKARLTTGNKVVLTLTHERSSEALNVPNLSD